MRWLRPAVFGALVLATVGAFFVTQHLKISTPLINGDPRPDPTAFNPVAGRLCRGPAPEHKLTNYRRVKFSFYLQHHADTVAVYVISQRTGAIVATLATSRYMRVDVRNPDGDFRWNGRESDGEIAPDGTYYFEIALQHEGRSFLWTQAPFQIITTPPHPAVTRVQVTGTPPPTTGPALVSMPGQTVTIHFTRGHYLTAFVDIYRTDLGATPVLVKRFGVNGPRGVAVWDGTIKGAPAPSGTYLAGLSVTDQACNPGRFPVVLPPPTGTTPHAGVTVRLLAAQPPLTPTGAGSVASVGVWSAGSPYRWRLWRVGRRKPLLGGRATGGSATPLALQLTVPALGAGLYELSLEAANGHTIVPLIASAQGRRAAAPVLVVLPALTWQGRNPVDDNGDGMPVTLAAGDAITLARPLVDGLPAGFGEEAALLAYLDAHHLSYQLTSDLALATHVGPTLAGHSGVIFDGSVNWLPGELGPSLEAYVGNGGHIVSIGQDSMLRSAPLSPAAAPTTAGPPSATRIRDPFGAAPGQIVQAAGESITVISDPLGIFSTTSGLFDGYPSYEVIAPPSGVSASLAGIDAGQPGITGFRLGRGSVVEIGLTGFNSSLAHDPDAQALLARLWQILSR